MPWAALASLFSSSRPRIALFVDTYYLGLAERAFFSTNDRVADSVLARVPSGLVVLSAPKGRGVASEERNSANGYFTGAFVRAIAADRWATDTNGNGAIEVSQPFALIRAEVVRWTRDTANRKRNGSPETG